MKKKRTQWNSSLPAREQPLKRGKPPKARNAKRKGHRFPKNVDEGLREYVRGLWCCNCGQPAPSHPHHVRPKSLGAADRNNLAPLCAFCHDEVHRLGRRTFFKNYWRDFQVTAVWVTKAYDDLLASRYPAPDQP